MHAGTNDMNPNGGISTEDNDPAGAADQLGKLIDQMIKACPDATILVAMIINTCNDDQSPRTKQFQSLVPGIVKKRRAAGSHVLAVDFTSFQTSMLRDCIHPTNPGYKLFGDYWYDFVTQIPKDWIRTPVGPDPTHLGGVDANGGLDKNIPPPDWGTSPVRIVGKAVVQSVTDYFRDDDGRICNANPVWQFAGEIALGGVGHAGDW